MVNEIPCISPIKSGDSTFMYERSPLRCNLTAEFTPPSKRKIIYGDRYIPSHVRKALNFDLHYHHNQQQKMCKKEKICNNINTATNTANMTTIAPPIALTSTTTSSGMDRINDYDDNQKEHCSIHEKQFETVYRTVLKNELCDTRIENLKNTYNTEPYVMDTSERMYHFTYKESNECRPCVFSTSPRVPYSPSNQKLLRSNLHNYRKISRHPFKVLDAPGLPNDYYLNLLDWSAYDVVAVALGNRVYLWEFRTCKVTNLTESLDTDGHITCVNWCHDNPEILCYSTNNGSLYLHDVKAGRRLKRRQVVLNQRIGCIDWNGNILSTGCRDGIIRHFDIRLNTPFIHHNNTNTTTDIHGHNLEVCGVKWDLNGKILASGGNDNKIFLWNLNQKFPIVSLNGHQGAVKALSWSPHEHGILASGGGSADKCIKFWNTQSYQMTNSIDTCSQVCNLSWSLNDKELISTHGFSSNAINVWSYPTMEKLASLKGHTSRVVYMSSSPDGEKIVTGSADETLRFWNVFSKNSYDDNKNKLLFDKFGTIR